MKKIGFDFLEDILKAHFLQGGRVLVDAAPEVFDSIQFAQSEVTNTPAENFKKLEDNYFDCVVLAESLQRDQNFFNTLQEARRVLKPGGLVVIVTAGMNRPKTTREKWRFTDKSLSILLEGFSGVQAETRDNGEIVCACAWKKQAVNLNRETAQKKEYSNA